MVVDGSNIATEGRSMPSLAQLDEAVRAFHDEHPDATITVVVDATFGHRIDKSEVAEFDAAVANNELVAPPAGAVGRGDAFVLGIADKAKASILSNDSFQEFHADFEWLFDEGRLIGGKPVPHVGWVFVNRVPVRGPVSRKVTRESGRSRRSPTKARTGSKEASQPMPVPKAPPPVAAAAGRSGAASEPSSSTTVEEATAASSSGRGRRRRGRGGARVESETAAAASAAPTAPTRPSNDDYVNDLVPFLDFVEHHPVGTSVNATVESYSSHGAYVLIGDVRGYVPLRLMADPPPRSARQVMAIGDSVTVVVASFAPGKRSIDCALPHMATDIHPEDPAELLDELAATVAEVVPERPRAAKKRAAPRRTAAKRSATEPAEAEQPVSVTEQTGSDQDRSSATEPAPVKKAPARKSAAKKAAAKKAPAKKSVAKKAPAENAAAKKAPAERAPAKKAAARKSAATKAAAKKGAARKSAARKSAATPTTPGRSGDGGASS